MSGSSKGGGSGDTQTTTVKNEPWSGLQPYLTDVYGQAESLYNSGGPQAYGGTTVAPFSPHQQMGMDLITGRALSGSAVNDNAQTLAADTLSGNYLSPDSNPWLAGTVQRAQESVMPGINATFAGSGRTGSGMHQDNLVEGLGNVASNMYMQNYGAERDRQMSTMGMAPQLAASDYNDFDRLMGVGGMIQGQAQGLIGDQKNRWDFYQTGAGSPWANLNNYAGILAGQPSANASGTQTQQQPMYGNDPMTNILGFAMMAAPYMMQASDRRVKKNIKPVGKLGQHMRYLFQYIGSDEWNFGVMADEVEKIQPGAVIEINGIKHVNYGALA